ncbi:MULTISPECIES: hypothetical protein [Raoultella]|uniref:hypothetical protein n=1 Tax=Raoultella TaxID=160674 RepID=UPI001F35E61B|nr:hypothetical protein [Raoultella planticola]MCE9858016.1 hypothetical protein [Raoultella planticola]
MTSKLTRDIIQSEIADFFAGVVEIHTELGGPNSVEEAQNQLTERVLACVPAVDSEPVFFIEVEGDDWINAGRIEGKNRQDLGLLPDGINYLYVAPQPVVSFYRDGIEAAAKWIDQQREAYDSEHGWSDPDTGAFEYGNDAQREYSSTLEELAEGIRALHPNAGMQPAPVVPDGLLSMAASAIEDLLEHTDPNTSYYSGVWADVPGKLRAAMIAAAPQEVKP